MTCDEVREQLAEHLLGTLDEPSDLEVRRHLRGCASCRSDMAALSDGVDTLARAAHDIDPPEELRAKVLEALDLEWADTADVVVLPARRARFGRAAVAVALAATLAWAGVATVRSVGLQQDAERYRTFLSALDGEEVRVAELRAAGAGDVQGSVVIYDSRVGQSWVLVLCRAPGWEGTANVTMRAGERTIDLRPMEFGPGGEGSTWLVTATDLTTYDEVSVWTDSGLMASAELERG